MCCLCVLHYLLICCCYCLQYFESDDPDLYRTKIQYIRDNDVSDLELLFADEEFSDNGTAQVCVCVCACKGRTYIHLYTKQSQASSPCTVPVTSLISSASNWSGTHRVYVCKLSQNDCGFRNNEIHPPQHLIRR